MIAACLDYEAGGILYVHRDIYIIESEVRRNDLPNYRSGTDRGKYREAEKECRIIREGFAGGIRVQRSTGDIQMAEWRGSADRG